MRAGPRRPCAGSLSPIKQIRKCRAHLPVRGAQRMAVYLLWDQLRIPTNTIRTDTVPYRSSSRPADVITARRRGPPLSAPPPSSAISLPPPAASIHQLQTVVSAPLLSLSSNSAPPALVSPYLGLSSVSSRRRASVLFPAPSSPDSFVSIAATLGGSFFLFLFLLFLLGPVDLSFS